MAPKGQKRDAAATKKAVASKKSRVEATDADPVMIALIGTIQQAEELSQHCRSMLIEGLKGSLNTPSDQRHNVQTMVVRMLEEVIVGKQNGLQKQLDDAKTREVGVNESKTALTTKLNEAEGILVEKSKVLDEKTQAQALAKENEASAASAHAEKQAIQTSGDSVMHEKQASKESIEQAIAEDFKGIQEGTGACDKLLPIISKLNFDESLIKALPGTCARPPAERGPFDAMVMSQLEVSLKDTLEKLTKAVEDEACGVKARAEAVEAALATMQKEADSLKKAEEELSAAEAARVEAKAAVDSVKKEIKEHKPKERDAMTSREKCEAELKTFETDIRSPFEERRDAKAKVEPQEVSEMLVDTTAQSTESVQPAIVASPAKADSPQTKVTSPVAEVASPVVKTVVPMEEEQEAPVAAAGA